MSQENVEIARASLEDFAETATDSGWRNLTRPRVEAMLAKMAEIWHPDIEWDASEAAAVDLGGVYRGVVAVQEWWRRWFAAWETVEFEYELVDAGDRVVVLLDQRMRGRSTGIEVSLGKYAQVVTFSDGRMVHWKVYMSQANALEAVGLSE